MFYVQIKVQRQLAHVKHLYPLLCNISVVIHSYLSVFIVLINYEFMSFTDFYEIGTMLSVIFKEYICKTVCFLMMFQYGVARKKVLGLFAV